MRRQVFEDLEQSIVHLTSVCNFSTKWFYALESSLSLTWPKGQCRWMSFQRSSWFNVWRALRLKATGLCKRASKHAMLMPVIIFEPRRPGMV